MKSKMVARRRGRLKNPLDAYCFSAAFDDSLYSYFVKCEDEESGEIEYYFGTVETTDDREAINEIIRKGQPITAALRSLMRFFFEWDKDDPTKEAVIWSAFHEREVVNESV